MKKSDNFFDHLDILRRKIILILISLLFFFIFAFLFRNKIVFFISEPVSSFNLPELNFYFFRLYGKFLAYIKLSFYFSILCTIPIAFFLLISFIYPALYTQEKKTFLALFSFSPLLYFFSIFFVYKYLAPFAIKFFLSFSSGDNIDPLLNFAGYIDLIFFLIIFLSLIFQTPVILLLLIKFNIISTKMLIKFRKYIVILIFIFAALFTPPDVISQILVGSILYLLFEFTILIAKVINRNKNEKDFKNENN